MSKEYVIPFASKVFEITDWRKNKWECEWNGFVDEGMEEMDELMIGSS